MTADELHAICADDELHIFRNDAIATSTRSTPARPRALAPTMAGPLSATAREVPEAEPRRADVTPEPQPVRALRLVPAEVAPAAPLAMPPSSSYDDAVMALLEATPHPGETIAAAFQRKEHALRALFAALTVVDARDLHRRLANPATGDTLALRFHGLVAERRVRLLRFLEDARRRAAIAHARHGGL